MAWLFDKPLVHDTFGNVHTFVEYSTLFTFGKKSFEPQKLPFPVLSPAFTFIIKLVI